MCPREQPDGLFPAMSGPTDASLAHSSSRGGNWGPLSRPLNMSQSISSRAREGWGGERDVKLQVVINWYMPPHCAVLLLTSYLESR